jgi:peptide/nickel transport system ATP-binding protein
VRDPASLDIDHKPGLIEPPAALLGRRLKTGRRRAVSVLGLVGAGLIAVMLVTALLAPVVARHDPLVPSGLPFKPPSAAHPLGTNDVGQDIFSQVVYGARISLSIGLLAALIALGLGLAVALVAGYKGGVADAVLMRIVDLTLAFPFLPLVIVLAAFIGRRMTTTALVIGAVIWARPARVLRSQVLKIREFDHVTAARAMGSPTRRILLRHVLPRTAPLAAAQFVRAANVAVLIEASLAFLGLGDPNQVSWGTILFFANSHSAFLTRAWVWWILPPGLALTAAIVGFAFLGYAVEEWADPRLGGRAARRTQVRRPGGEPESAPSPAHVLEVEDLVVTYDSPAGAVTAVDGASFSIGRGRIVGLVGESGSGKSTLAMAVMRLTRRPGRLAGGRILLDGLDLASLGRWDAAGIRGRKIVLVPQSAMNALNPAYPIRRQVAEAAALTRRGDEAKARADELLEVVGIPAARRGAFPHELSGGMRQRVVIAMALANEPSLLVADEPVTGLDVVTQATILRLLLDLQARFGLSILLISHDLPVVARVSDDLLVMYAGRIVESGPAERLRTAPRHPYTRHLLRAFPSLRGPRRPLASIPGETPDLSDPPTGCRFHPRCPVAIAACCQVDPPLDEVGPGHRVACLLEHP